MWLFYFRGSIQKTKLLKISKLNKNLQYLPKEEIEKRIRDKRKQMEAAAKALDFIAAAKLRDEITILKEQV
jgi:excinuclease UvrABC helicase subunit UvrB